MTHTIYYQWLPNKETLFRLWKASQSQIFGFINPFSSGGNFNRFSTENTRGQKFILKII